MTLSNYLQQHNKIYDEIIKKIQNGKVEVYPDYGRLIKEFRKITEKEG